MGWISLGCGGVESVGVLCAWEGVGRGCCVRMVCVGMCGRVCRNKEPFAGVGVVGIESRLLGLVMVLVGL